MSGLKGVRKSEALTDIYLWHILTYKSIGLLSKRRCGAKHIWKVKKLKARQRRSTFGSQAVEKAHVAVVRSTGPSKQLQSNSASEHF